MFGKVFVVGSGKVSVVFGKVFVVGPGMVSVGSGKVFVAEPETVPDEFVVEVLVVVVHFVVALFPVGFRQLWTVATDLVLFFVQTFWLLEYKLIGCDLSFCKSLFFSFGYTIKRFLFKLEREVYLYYVSVRVCCIKIFIYKSKFLNFSK